MVAGMETLSATQKVKIVGTEPKRQAAIPEKLGVLELEITQLEETFSVLHERLSSVRRQDVHGIGSEEKKEVSESCELAEMLWQQTARIRNLRTRIEYNLSAIEL